MEKHHPEELKSNTPKDAFVPPRHWIGPEELEASYWNDPQIREKRAQEFYEKPVEIIDQIDRMDKKGVARRDFLTVMGASMAMASFACARRPVNKIIPYVVKPEEITPGVPTWYASTCKDCETSCGILVKTREGRPIKLEGNPDHPVNKGALCSRGQASVLNLYDPDRLKAPLIRSRADGSSKEGTWAEVDAAISKKFKEIASRGGQVRVLSEDVSGQTTGRLIKEFLSAFKAGESSHVEFEPLSFDDISESQKLTYGAAVTPHYRFDRAEWVLSLGADFLGLWVSPEEHSREWVKGRKLSGKSSAQAKLSKLVCFEPTMTITGAGADERYPIRPGDELKVALAIANELIVGQKASAFAHDATVLAALQGYTSEKVAAEIGLDGGASVLKKIAQDLWAHRGKSLVVGGGIQSQAGTSLALQIAVNLLNSALENEGATVEGTVKFSAAQPGFAPLARLMGEMKSGQVDALIVYRSNPAYTLPKLVSGLEEAMKKVPLVIVVSDREDETAHLADYVLPDNHYLENWGDAKPREKLYSLQQPVIAPIHSTRAFQDSLLTWAKSADLKVSGLAARAQDWHAYLQTHWKETLYPSAQSVGNFDQFWEGVLRVGVFDMRGAQGGSETPTARKFKTEAVKLIPVYSAQANGQIFLSLYSSLALYDGRNANNAWLQELPDPISSVTWDNYLNVGPTLAKKLGVQNDDVVEVHADGVTVHLPVYVQPGMHPQTVSAAVGYGRRSVGKVGNQAGVDLFPFVRIQDGRLVYSGSSVTLKKTGKFYRLAATQWHTATEDRPIINDITLAEYRKNPAAAQHTDPHLRLETVPTLWSTHEYKGYRWGMAIDLNSCTGCGACMIACQAENNIPVVGRDQVRVSRQMHWIRIDRYYSGSSERPDVVFQPMLCQHCENASCETVCPVLATVHDDEGLNVQVYNRCVGTRYCQNNCPYKVRRFNFFDHWKSYKDTMNMVWNPDVTVRTRGIMEKCTFCTQRIRDAKDKAKDAGEKVADGQIKPACQQTCSTDAIIFGDLNDPNSRVSRMKESPQAFRVLEVLNNKPSISYMTKVRNKSESHGHHS